MTTLKGDKFKDYLVENGIRDKSQLELYNSTYKYHAIYHLGEYYLTFSINTGYKSISALKRQISRRVI